MNKTISINLGGFFFHIDEDAYQKLTRYFEAVKRSLDPNGKEEIISDIESRVAELFQARLQNEKQVVGLPDVDYIISIMGQPEDYKLNEEPTENSSNYTDYYPNVSKPKRLYRDGDNAILGGVAAGFSHYFNIDPLWIRILFIISPFISFGTSIIIYIILWILIPEAITTSQKLEMRGEPINFSNIEKKVKEGISDISDKINSIDGQKVANTAKRGVNQVATTIGDAFLGILKILGKILGVFIIIMASFGLIGIIISGIVMIFSASFPDTYIFNHINTPLDFSVPLWIQGILFILTIGIPLFFLLILGLNLLVTNIRSIGNYVKISLFAIWLVALGFLIYFGIKQATEKAYSAKITQKEEVITHSTDTLFLKMVHNNFYTKNVTKRTSHKMTHNENNQQVLYSNNVRIYYLKTDKTSPSMEIEKSAVGSSYEIAKGNAEKIRYNFEIRGNKINLDNYFITDYQDRFKEQEISIFLYIPEGTIIFPDKSIEGYLKSNYSDIDIYYGEEGKFYQLLNGDLECISCPKDENDTLPKNISVKINDKEWNLNVNENKVIFKQNKSNSN